MDKSILYNHGQSLIGIIIVLCIVGAVSGGFYYFLKQFFEMPEIKIIEPVEMPKPTEEIIPPEEEVTPEKPKEEPTPASPGPTCQNECSPIDSKKCSNNGYRVCGNYDDDECLEWGSIIECPTDNICKNGVCAPKTCSDNTLYGKCSSKKPKYCDNGTLINKCSLCGCPTNYLCQEDESCIQCNAGPCCDTLKNAFRSSSYKCEENVNIEYGCPWKYERGSNVGIRYQYKYCSGSSAECNGALKWGSWTVYQDCATDQACLNNYCNSYIEYNITASLSGLGSGTITASPSGINCENDCSESYPLGTSVTLTATANEGSAFTGWSGDCTGTAKCVLTMNANKLVTASFSITYTLNVNKSGSGSGAISSSPSGINCGNDCSEFYPQWTAVTLTATPAADSVFAGWTGVCVDVGKCNLVMNGDKTAIAIFNIKTTITNYNLSVSKSGTGSGIVTSSPVGINCGSDCSESYQSGTSVTLYTTALGDSVFGGWEGACTGNETKCILTMDGTKSVKAIFNTP